MILHSLRTLFVQYIWQPEWRATESVIKKPWSEFQVTIKSQPKSLIPQSQIQIRKVKISFNEKMIKDSEWAFPNLLRV